MHPLPPRHPPPEAGTTPVAERLEVFILSSDPMAAWAVRELLGREPESLQCRVSDRPPWSEAARHAPDVLVLAPQTW